MSTRHLLQWIVAALLLLAGAVQFAAARRHSDPLKAKNARTSGALFLLAGAVFALLAADVI